MAPHARQRHVPTGLSCPWWAGSTFPFVPVAIPARRPSPPEGLFRGAALCGVGLVMVLSASAWTSLTQDGSVWTIFERQALWMGIGLTFFGDLRLDYQHWRKFGFRSALSRNLVRPRPAPGIGLDAEGRAAGSGSVRFAFSRLSS